MAGWRKAEEVVGQEADQTSATLLRQTAVATYCAMYSNDNISYHTTFRTLNSTT